MAKHLFGWNLRYEEDFQPDLPAKTFIELAARIIEEKLKWDTVHIDERSIEAKARSTNFLIGLDSNYSGEKITITFSEAGTVNVISKSINVPAMWDMGRNYLRVTGFINHFQEVSDQMTPGQIKEFEDKTEEVYNLPENLPPPIERGNPNISLTIIGAISIALILAAILAFASSRLYIFLLFEAGVGFALSLAFSQLVKLSRYTKIRNIQITGIIGILILYFFNQYFQYWITMGGNNIELGFLEFIRSRLEVGFTIQRGGNRINLGPIGLIGSWVFQVGFTYLIFHLRVIPAVMAFQIEKIPTEVIEFILNYLNEEKSEEYIRDQLAKKGWSDKEDQDSAFDAVDSFISIHQMRR